MSDTANLAAYERWYGNAPGSHNLSTLDNFEADPANTAHKSFLVAARKIVDNWQGDQFVGLMLSGGPSTGKTHAAIGLARALHDTGAEVFFRYAPQLDYSYSLDGGWSAARLPEYSLGADSTKTIQTTTPLRNRARKVSGAATVTTYQHAIANSKKPNFSANSVFPSQYLGGFERNPKVVLVLDDVKPALRKMARSAIETAANFGGLIIMTTNFADVANLAAPDEGEMLNKPVNAYGLTEAELTKANEPFIEERRRLTEAFMSRIAGNIAEIEFTGEDQRQRQPFWTDNLDPSDFS